MLLVESVVSVGTDAVMVADADAISDPTDALDAPDAPDDLVRHGSTDVLDDEVFTESGRSLGVVRDVIVLGGSRPRVVGFEIGGGAVGDGLVPLGAQTSVSGSALVVPDDFEGRIRSDLTGLAAELSLIESSGS